jgi:hypothetical protein
VAGACPLGHVTVALLSVPDANALRAIGGSDVALWTGVFGLPWHPGRLTRLIRMRRFEHIVSTVSTVREHLPPVWSARP